MVEVQNGSTKLADGLNGCLCGPVLDSSLKLIYLVFRGPVLEASFFLFADCGWTNQGLHN